MAWYRVQLTAAVQEVVIAERECHPQSHVRRKMLVLWLLPCGITRAKAATVAGLGRATVQRYVAAYRDGGLDGLRQWDVTGPVSDLASFTDAISASLTAVPVRTVAEACDRIEQLTGLRREPTQVRTFLKGLKLQCGRCPEPNKYHPNGQVFRVLGANRQLRDHCLFQRPL
jgi:transposase